MPFRAQLGGYVIRQHLVEQQRDGHSSAAPRPRVGWPPRTSTSPDGRRRTMPGAPLPARRTAPVLPLSWSYDDMVVVRSRAGMNCPAATSTSPTIHRWLCTSTRGPDLRTTPLLDQHWSGDPRTPYTSPHSR